jgi:hypothetical protein
MGITDGGTVYKRVIINAKLRIGKRGKKNWKKEVKVCIGL